MPSTLSTLEDALEFKFYEADCLYRDHSGRRVIVDVEGSGEMDIQVAIPPLVHVREEEDLWQFCPLFENGALVLANGPGEVLVRVQRGRTTPITGDSFTATDRFVGAGWIVGADSAVRTDDRHQYAPPPSRNYPVPFFRQAQGKGTIEIVPAVDFECRQIDQFEISDRDALSRIDFKVQNASTVSQLHSTFADGTPFSGPVMSHLNTASFTLDIPKENDGLIIRKTFDRFHGRQRARVFVEDELQGWWFEPGEDRNHRWHKSDFGVSPKSTRGKDRIRIAIEPPAGVPLWSVSKIEVYALINISRSGPKGSS